MYTYIYGVVLLLIIALIIVNLARLFVEKVRAESSVLSFDGQSIKYRFTKTGDTDTNGPQIDRCYIIESITNIIETSAYVKVFGQIRYYESFNSRTKHVSFVEIPKYFEELNSIIDKLKR